ncbi:MAG: signal peptidase I [Bacteroidetes bacterium]|nr:signal peptidase I [Bacteroidota bacterium]
MPEQSVNSTIQDSSNNARPEKKSRASSLAEYGKIIIITVFAALLLKTFVVDAYQIPSASMEQTLQIGDFLLVNKLSYGFHSPGRLSKIAGTAPSFLIPFFKNIGRGDVIVFKFPEDKKFRSEKTYYIKRCIGLPGDTVEIKAGLVYVNNVFIPFPPNSVRPDDPAKNSIRQYNTLFPENSNFSRTNYGPVIVPKKNEIVNLNTETLPRLRKIIEQEGHTVRIIDNTTVVDGKEIHEYCIEKNYYFVLGDNRDNSLDSRYWGFLPEKQIIGEALIIYWSWDTGASVSGFAEKFSSIRWDRIGTLIK